MHKATPEKIKRLPKWAQDIIGNLERQNADLREQLLVNWQDEETDFGVSRMSLERRGPAYIHFPLVRGDCPTVAVPDSDSPIKNRVRITRTLRGEIEIMADREVAIQPRACNTFLITHGRL